MVIKKGCYGMFIGCINFFECYYIEGIKVQQDMLVDCFKCKEGYLIDCINKYGKWFFVCNCYF